MSRPLPPFSPDPSLAARVRELAAQHGVTRARSILGVSAETFGRLAAGLGVRRGTVVVAERALAEFSDNVAGIVCIFCGGVVPPTAMLAWWVKGGHVSSAGVYCRECTTSAEDPEQGRLFDVSLADVHTMADVYSRLARHTWSGHAVVTFLQAAMAVLR